MCKGSPPRDGSSRKDASDSTCPGADHPSRRKALKLILGGALASAGLTRSLQGAALVQDPGRDVLVGDLSELPPGSAARAKFHGMPVLVINVEGDPVVLSAVCTHEGCTVDWDAEKKTILCPCHAGQFNAQGEVLDGPPPAALLRFPVRVEDGKIYIEEK